MSQRGHLKLEENCGEMKSTEPRGQELERENSWPTGKARKLLLSLSPGLREVNLLQL